MLRERRCYMEFGAGRGKLLYWIHRALGIEVRACVGLCVSTGRVYAHVTLTLDQITHTLTGSGILRGDRPSQTAAQVQQLSRKQHIPAAYD